MLVGILAKQLNSKYLLRYMGTVGDGAFPQKIFCIYSAVKQ